MTTSIMPGTYPADNYRHKAVVMRVWFRVQSNVEGYCYGVGKDDYSIFKTGNGPRPWVVYRHGKAVFRCWGNGLPFGTYKSAVVAIAAVDQYELKGRTK